jgi:hypothetical protein
MNKDEQELRLTPHFMLMVKLYSMPKGRVLIIMGDFRLMLGDYQVQALLDGTLNIGATLASLHRELDTTVLEVLEENNKKNRDIDR